MIVELVRRARAMLWPSHCRREGAQLEAAEAKFLAATARANKAAFDLIDQTVTGGSPDLTPAERIEALTDDVIAKIRREAH